MFVGCVADRDTNFVWWSLQVVVSNSNPSLDFDDDVRSLGCVALLLRCQNCRLRVSLWSAIAEAWACVVVFVG